MSNQYFNFAYDPVRQGYDSNTWNTILGVPVVINNQLSLEKAEIIHYADLLRGDAIFNISMSAPAVGDDVKIGFSEEISGSISYFRVIDDVLEAVVSNGTTLKTQVIDWDTTWSNTNIEFRVWWEAGSVKFYIEGQLMANFGEISTLDVPIITIPNVPMSLYLYNDSADPLSVKYITVKGVQSLV